MASKGKAESLKRGQDMVKRNFVRLLQENNGKLGIGELQSAYARKFRVSLSKKDLHVNKLIDFFSLYDYDNDFEIQGEQLVLKTFQKTDKYGMPLPKPIKPIWGAAAMSTGAGSSSGNASRMVQSGGSVQSSLQKARERMPTPSRAAAKQASSTSKPSVTSVQVSSSDTESDSDSEVEITRSDPPVHKETQKKGIAGSGFLSFDVPVSEQQQSQLHVAPSAQHIPPMLFSNQSRNPEGANQRGPGAASGIAPPLTNMAGGRGRVLDMHLQQTLPQFQNPSQMMAPFQRMPQPVQTTAVIHPVVPTCNDSIQSGQHQPMLSRGSSENNLSASQPAPPPPPPEPTWPPNNPKLGIPPGVPRERKQVTVKPVPVQFHRLTKEQVEAVAEDCIETLAETGDYVSPDRIVKLLLQRYQVRDLRDLQVQGLRYPYHINCVNEHERLLSKVNASIEAFVLSRSLCTLYDLERSLIEYGPNNADNFEAMRLGPLQCLPVVYEKFKFPQDEKIPDISTADVLEVFGDYLTKQQKWTTKLNMEEVMAYFVDYYHVTSAYSLGIRIRSLPLAAQVLKKSHRDSSNTRKAVINRCMKTVQDEVHAAFQKAKATLFQTVQDGEEESVELRDHYFKIPAEDVLLEFMEKFRLLLSIDTPTSRNDRKRLSNIEQGLNMFQMVMRSEPLARAFMHLAVCVGKQDLCAAALEVLAPKTTERNAEVSGEGPQAEQHRARQPPSKATLMEKVKRYVERCLAQGMLTLSNLDRIEEKLLEEFGFPTFFAMGFGRFLHFMLHDPAPKALLEESGGVSLGGSHQAQGRAQMTEVLEFLRQCKAASVTQEIDAEKALCHQFHITEVRHLGLGNMRHLIDASEKPGKHQSRDFRVLYEMAFCGKTSEPLRGKREVGMLGHQTRDAALACLQSCPFMEDLERWSHWSLVFEPQYGSLKDFLQKYGGVHTINADGGQKTITTDIVALETQPGCLLRLVSTTSPVQFESAARQGNARTTCGHLVSLVMANRGVEHTPMALLANHTRAALFVLHTAASDVPGGPSQATGMNDPAILFVLDCLLLLPLRLCIAVANQVFLEPLAQVVGSSRSKSLVLEACRSQVQSGVAASPTRQMELARLGCMLGIQEWTSCLTDTFTFPPECVTVIRPQQPVPRDDLLGDDEEGAEEEEEEESEEESEEEDQASSVSFLSDEEEEEKVEMDTTEEEKKETADKELEVANIEEESEDSSGDDDDDEEDSEEEDDDDDEEEEEDQETEEGEEGEKPKKKKVTDDSGINNEESTADMDSDDKAEAEMLDPCQVIIEQIRRDEFGVGVELNEDGQRLMQVQQERLGRSLDRLSRDLYSKDTHFVLELVQNADDNSYPEELMASLQSSQVADECPAVHFIINKTGVTVLNNESGFREKDVRALCDVGRSTKGKHKYGYIGQKGIGFKSVFRVTSRPEVHSNGFHLCFDVNSGPMGFILPHWCEDEDPQAGWMTKIVLPLKEEMMTEARSLAARFNDIHPSLLLFLHRLRSIHIDNKVEGSQLSMRRVDLGENIVEIHHSQGATDRWLVVKKKLDASTISLQAKSGVEVESTEIALAFPLTAVSQRHHVQVAPAKQPVFAFLPLRSYGFRFIVQGDFDVPSSREDVDRDSSWNQWLRNEIHTLFIEAFDIFRTHPEFEDLQSLWSYLQFVPLEDEILDFFKPVATQILQKMRATPCMPTIGAKSGKTGEMQWKLPSQTLMVQDALVHEVISPELLEQHLGLFYVHRDAAAKLSPLLTRSLGVESITSDHLIQVGRSLACAWGQKVADEQVVQIAKWLACIYRSMDDFQENSHLISTLQGMRVIPLSTGELVALDEVTVFMLTDSGGDTVKTAPGKREPLSVLRQDLHLIHGNLTATADDEVNSQVSKLLHKLDIKQLSAQDIVHHHILPILRSQQWQSKDRSVLVSYLIFIKEQRSRNHSLINMEELKTVARVLTNHGVKNPATDKVHFTPSYGVSLNLATTLPGYDWTLLDSLYLPFQATKLDIQSWQEFFTQLGVVTFLIVRREEVRFKREEMDSTPWSMLKDMWPASEETYLIQDFVCEELQQLVMNNTSPNTLKNQMKSLFQLLDSSWDLQYAQFASTQLQSGQSSSVLRDSIPSSFAIALQTLHWVLGVESTVISVGKNATIEEKESLLQPSVLYIPDPQIKRLLAHTAYYLACQVSSTSSFSRFLCIKTQVETKVVHDALIEWGKRDPSSPDKAAVFCSTLAHLKFVYKYLYDHLPPKEAQDLFHNNAVIFVPTSDMSSSTSHQKVVGRMLKREEVWWHDTSGLFLKYRKSLVEFHSSLADRHPVEHLYRDLAETFFGAARVQKEPSVVNFAELLTLLASAYTLKEEGILADVMSIYARIGRFVSADDLNVLELNTQKDVVNTLKNKKVLASKHHTWVSVADKPMLADDPELEKMFASKEGVHFLLVELPRTPQQRAAQRRRLGGGRDNTQVNSDDVLAFMALFEIQQLSEEVQKVEITEMFSPCTSGQQYFHVVVPYIQRYLVARYPEIQDAHHAAGMAARLKELLFVQTKKLQVKYSLKSLPEVYEIRDEKCVITGSNFYFHEKHVESLMEINKEMARFFSDGNIYCMKDLRQFLMELQPLLENERELRNMLKREDVGPLPPDYLRWEVPKPVILKPPTPPPPPPPPPPPAASAEAKERAADSDGPTLRAWPPPAPGERRDNPSNRPQGEGRPMGPTIWPPPKAPEELKRQRDLPSNLHMAPRSAESGESAHRDSDSVCLSDASGRPSGVSGVQRSTSGQQDQGERREGVDRQVSQDRKRSEAGDQEGSGGGTLKRQDSALTGDSRKRKGDPADASIEVSETKRSAPDDGISTPPAAAAVADTHAAMEVQPQAAGETGPAPVVVEEQPANNQTVQPRKQDSITRKGWPPYRPRPDQLQLPVWSQLASEIEYEELGRGGDLKIPTNVTLTESSDRVEVGRWGEHLVYDYLMQQKQMHEDIYDVMWLNQVEESGKPYDFEVVCTTADQAYTLYIEVKATRSSQKEVFEISANEVKFASEYGEQYHIYRIFSAGTTDQVQLVRLTNVSHKMESKEVRLLMVI